MDTANETKTIVKTIRTLEGVLRTTPSATQRARVKKELDQLRQRLGELYPGEDLQAVEQAVGADMLGEAVEAPKDFSNYETLKHVEIQQFSSYKDDRETNEAASIMIYFEERIWGVISDQHTKLDFSTSGERDTLYRKLDQCTRSLKIFRQTMDDIAKSKSNDHVNQLNLMRVKQARLFLYDTHDFFKGAQKFLTNLISESDFGGSMILNPEDPIVYADYEKYATFQGTTVINALKFMKKFVSEALEVIKVPEIKKA